MAANANLYEGSVYMARYLNGAWGDYTGPVESTRFAIKGNVDRKEQVSRARGRFGQVSAAVNVQAPADFSVTFTQGTPEVMAMGLMGTVAVLTTIGGTLTAVDVTASLDKWVPLTKGALTGAATVTNTGATITYVEGTDYLVNRTLGLFKALSTGDITVAQALKFGSAYGAITGSTIKGLVSADVRVRFLMDGRNLEDGADCKVTVHEAVLAAEDVVDFLSGEFISVPLSGRLVTPEGFDSPVEVEMRDLA